MNPTSFSPLILEILAVPDPWHAYLFRTSPLPLPPSEKDRLIPIVEAITAEAVRLALHHHVFLQTWKLSVEGAADLYRQNIAHWLPSIGIGIWPTRRPPQRQTRAIAMDCAAAVLAGDEVEMPAHNLAHVSNGDKAAAHAANVLLGTGMTVQIFSSAEFPDFSERGKRVFLPAITDVSMKRFRFYVPLLDGATLAAATVEQLEDWLCGASLYLRESPEDKGYLVISRFPLQPLFDAASTQ